MDKRLNKITFCLISNNMPQQAKLDLIGKGIYHNPPKIGFRVRVAVGSPKFSKTQNTFLCLKKATSILKAAEFIGGFFSLFVCENFYSHFYLSTFSLFCYTIHLRMRIVSIIICQRIFKNKVFHWKQCKYHIATKNNKHHNT